MAGSSPTLTRFPRKWDFREAMINLRTIGNVALPNALQRTIRSFLYRQRLSSYRPKVVRRNVFEEDIAIWIGDAGAERWYDRDVATADSRMKRNTP